ncbi:DNA-binding NarL/FixJ family response regulator [Saccharothrix tamanrassetensis]|uniref:DNA-binding NarL/FixJ family response regulator n=1 Tax=Saccharothrix tamanrassetensis TaxID=1051531 RepID=A0A841CK56_9PSEU|nr:response regulator transcription factor [Saccharothrix tamanrassetensis]MBB5957450.1 DNA-binding NarL/FixJ family response regulator [Saccharothrix tamanrassetensis]
MTGARVPDRVPDRVRVRVALAEDSGLLRDSLVALITRFGHEVVTAVGSADELLTAVRAAPPDIVVTDVRMPPTFRDEGLRAAIALRRERPGLPILVLSQHVDTPSLTELLDTGAAGTGYLLKDRVTNGTDFVAALDEVAAGGTVVDPEMVRRLLAYRRDPLRLLSARELEVLGLMAEGRSNTAIRERLVISEVTVSKHIGSIFTKLGLHSDGADHRRVLAVLTYLRGADAD